MKKKIDWIIHLVANGAVCEECGTVEASFLPNLCNAHTHGLYKYNHKDFQLVLNLPPQEIARILNTLGLMVQKGRKFFDGDLVEGIYLDCPVRIQPFVEDDRTVLRVVIPDKYNHFPEEPECGYPYKLQLLPTDKLTYPKKRR